MERLSVMAPSGHFSLSVADRLALQNAITPGEGGIPRIARSRAESALNYYQTRHSGHLDDKSAGLREEAGEEEVKGGATEFRPDLRFYLAFSSLAALSLVVALDGTSISVALPVITQYLNGTAIEGFWAGTSFLLCSTTFQPIYASFSDIFGRKNMTLLAVSVFLVGTVVAGTSHIMTLMLIGRSIQGIGASGIIALTNILITDMVPLRNRGNWVGMLGATWALGSVIGPVVGGSLAHTSTWQWIFYLNLPFITLSFAMVFIFIRLKQQPSTFLAKLRRADWFGSFVFVGSTTAILIPLTWGGVSFAWASWHVVAPVGFGICGLIILIYHELFVATEPVIRFAVFRNRTTNIAYLTTTLHGMVLWCLLYYQPLYYEGVRGFSPVISGVALFPATFTVAPTAIVTGIVISKFGRYRWAVWASWGCATLGIGFLCAVDMNTQLTQVLLTDLLAGVGLGGLFPALQFQLQAASDPKTLAFSVAMFSFFRGLGQTLGIAIGGTIFQNELASKLSQQPLFASRAQELARDATSLVAWMRNAPEGEARQVMRTAYTESLRTVYIALACVTFVATVSSLFIRHYDIDQAMETEQGFANGKEEE
ncbi:hypothetical protein LTR36_001545 [Oleoguttula mirabilis]|uniref:Major facilitator superfamily (MFS) profile domain-containing protein n=1 Tax=Oleoguttula mirabilis TaxID=1507867 RepID=A0AAV9JN81_9PEZI|nr:hypothetical protein LTR36_001545 [Oleoguttula mirabilis]